MENTKKRQTTWQKLTDSLIELCEEKGYYNITVQDICERAGTYRSTFYRYCDSKDDMLRKIEHEYVEYTRYLTQNLHSLSNLEDLSTKREVFLQELVADMKHHQKRRKLCMFLMSNNGDPHFEKTMQESIVSSMSKGLQKRGGFSPMECRYLANYLAHGFILTLLDWVKNQDCSAEEIAEFQLMMLQDAPDAIRAKRQKSNSPQR